MNVVLVIDYTAGDAGRAGHMAATPVMLIHACNAVRLRQLKFDTYKWIYIHCAWYYVCMLFYMNFKTNPHL